MVSLGCSKNLVDAEVMLGLLQDVGALLVVEPDQADVIIVNTCSFVNDAKEESVETILEMIDHKKGRCQKLVVAGCLPQRYVKELQAELPEVDLLVGTGEYHRIVELLEGQQSLAVAEPLFLHDHLSPRIDSGLGHSSWLKIAEGCDRHCSFCIIPTLRGRHRQREVESLLIEARRLVAGGVKELNVISQDLSQYGPQLLDLLRGLEQIDGLDWIRLLYFYPDDLSDEFIDYMASSKKLCRYLDMPVQHFADGVLRRMNRKISGAQIMDKIKRLRQRVSGIVLRTSIIVGFPGETENDFDLLLDKVEEAEFDHLGVFAYSDEEETASFRMKGKLDSKLINERRQQLYQLQEVISTQTNEKYLGQKIEVLVEGVHPETDLLLVGRHQGQAPEIDGVVIINDTGERQLVPGQMVMIEITEVAGYDLVGRLFEKKVPEGTL